MTAILVTGGQGQLGRELRRLRWPDGVEIVAPDRAALDLCDAGAIGRLLADRGVAAIVNAAAYTAVDRAETEIAEAFAVNALAPAALAQAAASAGLPLIHVSTDYVFDGAKSGPYEVDDRVDPIGVYGASKAAGELAVRLGQPRSAIVRTAWVVSAHRSNFLKTMLRLGQEREELRVVDDQHGAPTLAADLAEALATVTMRMIADEQAPRGLFHYANAGRTTWAGFAGAIFATAAERGLKTPKLTPIATADYPTPARRPRNSQLSTRRIEDDYGVVPRPWADGLGPLIDEILRSGS